VSFLKEKGLINKEREKPPCVKTKRNILGKGTGRVTNSNQNESDRRELGRIVIY